MNGREARVHEPEPAQPGERAFTRLAYRILDLARRLVEVHVHRKVQAFGEFPDLLERLVAHRVRSVRCEGGGDEVVAAEGLVHLESAREVRRPIPRPCGRYVEDDETEHGGFALSAADAGLASCLSEKIDYLTDDRRIGYAEWREDPSVFLRRAEAWDE